MQAIESQTLIIYHTDLRGEWPEEGARALAARFAYARRLTLEGSSDAAHASLAGLALALRGLAQVLGCAVAPGDLELAQGHKPRLGARLAARAGTEVDFSIAHSGPYVGCAVSADARVGFDLEFGTDVRLAEWVAREAVVKAAGLGIRALAGVELEPGGARLDGERWHACPVPGFQGAAACLMTSRPCARPWMHGIGLADLFAP